MTATLYYVHDPMCSWCWAFSKVHDELVAGLPDEVAVKRLLGGLAPDTDQDMTAEMRTYIRNHWQHIQRTVPRVQFNYGFWDKCRPRRATYPACRAVIAARHQGAGYDVKMTQAIQTGYYLQARNPSDQETLIAFAEELQLDTKRFAADLVSDETHEELEQEIRLSRQLGISGFPSLQLVTGGDHIRIPLNYTSSQMILSAIQSHLS